MAERRRPFRARDVTAAIKAAERAGKEVVGVRVDKDGFEIKTAPPGQTKEPETNEWDKVLP